MEITKVPWIEFYNNMSKGSKFQDSKTLRLGQKKAKQRQNNAQKRGQGRARISQEEPGVARRSRAEPGEAGRSHEVPGVIPPGFSWLLPAPLLSLAPPGSSRLLLAPLGPS